MPDVSIVPYATLYAPTAAVAAAKDSALALISQLLVLEGVSEKHFKEQLSIGLWKWTEAAGVAPHAKYNQRYVSGGVHRPVGPASINHEHVWTRDWMIKRLRAQRGWSTDDLRTFLTTYGVACVVTVQEHALLGGVSGDGWDRYRKAGIRVWDRELGQDLDLDHWQGSPPTTKRPSAPALGTPDSNAATTLGVQDLVEQKAERSVADRLHRLLRMARFASATAVPSLRQAGGVAAYFRVHDTLIGEPTPAVAYPHWSGKVSFRLRLSDLPAWLADDPHLQVLQQHTYALQVRLDSDMTLAIAEELLFLALEKLRGAYSD